MILELRHLQGALRYSALRLKRLDPATAMIIQIVWNLRQVNVDLNEVCDILQYFDGDVQSKAFHPEEYISQNGRVFHTKVLQGAREAVLNLILALAFAENLSVLEVHKTRSGLR